MSDELKPGDKVRIRGRQRNGKPLNWYDNNGYKAKTVSLEPGEVVRIKEPYIGACCFGQIHDLYWFTHPRLSKPMIIDSWSISPAR